MAKKLKQLLAVALALSMTMGLLNLTAFAQGEASALEVEQGDTLILSDKDGNTVYGGEVEQPGGILWESSDDAVASVEDGTVTGVSEGRATITRTGYGYRFAYEDENGETRNDFYDLDAPHSDEAKCIEIVTTWQVEVKGVSRPAAPEIPEETCAVDYQSMSHGVTVSYHEDDDTIYVEIGENASGDLVINLQDTIMGIINTYVGSVMPGLYGGFQVKIVNRSAHEYAYKDGSFVLASSDAHDYEQTIALGYDGQLIPAQYVGGIAFYDSRIYKNLYGVMGGNAVTAEMMFSIYDYLEDKGYTGDDALTQFILDQYGKTSVSQLNPDTFAHMGDNAIRNMSADRLRQLMEDHPEVAPYVRASEGADGSLGVQIKWTEPELAALSYNTFYQDYWSFGFGLESVQQDESGNRVLDPNGNTAFTRTRGIGDYQSGTDLYAQTDAYFSQDVFGEGANDAVIQIGMAFDGPGIGNNYCNYPMSFYLAFELAQTDGDVTVNKVDGGGAALEGAQFNLYKLEDGVKLYYSLGENSQPLWTVYSENAQIFEGGTFTVNLPFGVYYLSETAAPSGYNSLSQDLEFTVDQPVEEVNVTNTLDASTAYTVVHEYYTDDSLDGSTTSDAISGTVGQVVAAEDIGKITGYGENVYSFRSDSSDNSITLVKDSAQNVITLRYYRTTGGVIPVYYTVTVNYYDKDSGSQIAPSYFSGDLLSGSAYDVTDKAALQISGYTYDSASGDAFSGAMDGSKVINLYYIANAPDTDGGEDDDTPPVAIPDDPAPTTDVPAVDIPTEEVPKTDLPVIDIPSEDVPMAEVPATGDASLVWLLTCVLSGAGLAWLVLSEKKRRKENL